MATKTAPELDEFVALSQAKLGLSYTADDMKTLRKKSAQDLVLNIARLRKMCDYDAPAPVAEAATWEPEQRPQGNGNGHRRAARPAVSPKMLEYAASLLRRLWASDPESGEELVAELADKDAEQISRMIDNLKVLVAGMEASESQLHLLRRLYARKFKHDEELAAGFEAKLAEITTGEASKMIEMMDSLPDVPREQQAPSARRASEPEVEADGMYRDPATGDIYKVQVAHHGSGKLYAKKLVKLDEPTTVRGKETHFAFAMARGAIMKIKPEWRMTLADAKEFGDLYGCCIKCGTVLTDEASIERGIGPKCAQSF